jgi:hypothetical protein
MIESKIKTSEPKPPDIGLETSTTQNENSTPGLEGAVGNVSESLVDNDLSDAVVKHVSQKTKQNNKKKHQTSWSAN